MKVYIKKGKPNWRDGKLVKELEAIIEKKIAEDPSFEAKFKPATNSEELKELHAHYCIESVSYQDMPNGKAPQNVEADSDSQSDSGFEDEMEREEPKDVIDPFNREEPIVRDYVLNDELKADAQHSTTSANPNQTDFKEPITWGESFQLPLNEGGLADADKNKQGATAGSTTSGQQASPKKPKEVPFNTDFDTMTNANKKKKTKKLATYIVNAVCMLSEFGIVWYATNDINDTKLAEYELSGEFDLSLLVTLDSSQEVPIKQFFQEQVKQAKGLSKFTEEEKVDLIESLTEVLLEKGVALTPVQECAFAFIQAIAGKAIVAYQIKSQINNLLDQIRVKKAGQPTEERIPPVAPVYNEPVKPSAVEVEPETIAEYDMPATAEYEEIAQTGMALYDEAVTEHSTETKE